MSNSFHTHTLDEGTRWFLGSATYNCSNCQKMQGNGVPLLHEDLVDATNKNAILHHRHIESHIFFAPTPTTSVHLPGSRNGWWATAPILRAFVSPLLRRWATVSRRSSQDRHCKVANTIQLLTTSNKTGRSTPCLHYHDDSRAPAISATGACVAHNLANLHNDVRAPPTPVNTGQWALAWSPVWAVLWHHYANQLDNSFTSRMCTVCACGCPAGCCSWRLKLEMQARLSAKRRNDRSPFCTQAKKSKTVARLSQALPDASNQLDRSSKGQVL